MLDGEGNTALHVCARKGHVDVAYYLVEQGIPVDAVSFYSFYFAFINC